MAEHFAEDRRIGADDDAEAEAVRDVDEVEEDDDVVEVAADEAEESLPPPPLTLWIESETSLSIKTSRRKSDSHSLQELPRSKPPLPPPASSSSLSPSPRRWTNLRKKSMPEPETVETLTES